MNINRNIEPVVLLAATTWWSLAAKLAVSLANHGCVVEAVCPPGNSLRYVKGVRRFHLYRRLDSLRALRKAITAADPVLIVPCDDGVVAQLHELYHQRPELQALITRSLGRATYFDVVASRERLLQIAESMHIRVPQNIRVSTVNDLRDWFAQMDIGVLKQDGTWGGNGVRVVHSLPEATEELARMLRPPHWSAIWKRMLVNHDPLALWNRRRGGPPAVTLQEFIPGRAANIMMACWNGELLGAVTVEVLWSQGKMGAAMVVRLIHHGEITYAARTLAKRLELSGFYGLDFVIDSYSGAAYLIEMNPRCTQLGHLPIAGQGDLAGLLLAKLGAATAVSRQTPGLRNGETVAFFPKAFLWDSNNHLVRHGYMDAPQQEPLLASEMLKQDWPDRQWPARLYHWLRPPQREQAAPFEEPSQVAMKTAIKTLDE